MKLLNKEEVEESLGKLGLFNRLVISGKLNYISGIQPFDVFHENTSTWGIPGIINIFKRPKGMEIGLFKSIKSYSVGIKDSQVQRIDLESRDQIYEKQDKSVVGRALIGGLLLGPLGAVIGGMSGIGSKEVRKDMPDMILSITILNDSNEENIILFSAKHKEKDELDKFFSKIALSKYNRQGKL